MVYSDLTSQIKNIPLEEIRNESPAFFEFVIQAKSLPQLQPILENYFGTPFKPAGQSPSREAKKRTEPLGGIRSDQTLYFLEQENVFHCAMIWPWSDGERATVKIAQYEQKKA